MANAINPITHQFSTPYLTVAEFKNAPTAIDLDNLVFNSTDPDLQDAELANVIARASSWIDTYCNQILGATVDTERLRGRIREDGTFRVHPRYNPIIAVTALSFGPQINQITSMPDPSVCWVEDQTIVVPYASTTISNSSQGPLSFGFPTSPRLEIFINLTYVNGYANTLINTANAGDHTLTVTDATGIVAGQMLKIYDGYNSENVMVDSSYTFGSKTVNLVTPLQYSHASGLSISALPPAIKQAAILVTTAFLKVRGDTSMTMQIGTQASGGTTAAKDMSGDLVIARELLKPYRRIR